MTTSNDICETCGFPKDADREPVFLKNTKYAMAMHLGAKCDECGHYKDGSTIKDDRIREAYARNTGGDNQ